MSTPERRSPDDLDVLLVEDNPDDAEFILRALRKANPLLHVLHVDNGVKALDYVCRTGEHATRANSAPPRVMLLDLKLPKIDGLEVLRRLKEYRATKAMPIVVLTSSREERDIVESYLLGANSYIVKPIDYPELLSTLGELVRYWLQLNASPRP